MTEPKPINLAEFMQQKAPGYSIDRPKRTYDSQKTDYLPSSYGISSNLNINRYR